LYDEIEKSFDGLNLQNVSGLTIASVEVGTVINQREFYLAPIGYFGSGKIL
jgi:hypothetical protein